LEHVQVVQEGIGVPAVVGVAQVPGLELVEVGIGIDHVVALKVGADFPSAEILEIQA
jgi:hypothetical protein